MLLRTIDARIERTPVAFPSDLPDPSCDRWNARDDDMRSGLLCNSAVAAVLLGVIQESGQTLRGRQPGENGRDSGLRPQRPEKKDDLIVARFGPLSLTYRNSYIIATCRLWRAARHYCRIPGLFFPFPHDLAACPADPCPGKGGSWLGPCPSSFSVASWRSWDQVFPPVAIEGVPTPQGLAEKKCVKKISDGFPEERGESEGL